MTTFGLPGWSGSGKTTLLVKLIPELVRCGLTVSTLCTRTSPRRQMEMRSSHP